MNAKLWVAFGSCVGLLTTVQRGLAADLYVDNSLSADCVGSYEPTSRSCSGGTARAFATLAAGAAASQPGDTVWIRAGTYNEPLLVPVSGTSALPIVFQAYSGETPTISGLSDPGIQITGQSYIVVEGVSVTESLGWGRLEDTSHVTIRSNRFSAATSTGTTGGLKLVRATHTLVSANTFEDGNDNMVVQESDRNLIVNNTFHKGRHSLLSIRCGSFNIVRGNSFSNPGQKAAEIYDCEGVSDAPVRLDATKHNLVDGNVFLLTLGSDQAHDYNAIQYAGQQGIVRRNVFYDCAGGGLNFQVYADEALYNYGHRAYNNTFFHNQCYGLAASSDDDATRYYDNRATNNLLYSNTDCSGGPTQTSIGNTTAVILEGNAEASTAPGFVDEAARDLHLGTASPMIDAARFVTTAVGPGTGTSLQVADPGYFSDGYGIVGEAGDLIQFDGQSQTARVTAIEYATGQLTLDQPLSWIHGQGVHLAYAGSAPDMGAFESGLAQGGSAGVGGSAGTSGAGPGGQAGAATGGSAGTHAAGSAGATTGGSAGVGGASSDAGTSVPSAAQDDDSGCGCRAASRTGLGGWVIALVGSLVALHWRRRSGR